MAQLMLLDIPPDPAGVGALLAVVLLVVGLIALLAAGLVLFLWYRKRSMRGVVMIRPEALSVAGADRVQPSNPNQP
jgi:hypothetical protein